MLARYIFLLFLFFTSISNYVNSEDIKIEEAFGNLKEYNKEQIISFKISPSIDPNELSNIEITKDKEKFQLKTTCFLDNQYSEEDLIKCYLDLSKISFGTYKVINFNYKNIKYSTNILFEIYEDESQGTLDIQLTGISEDLREYQESQNFELFFSKSIKQPSRIIRMKYINQNNKKYSVPIRCSRIEYSTVSYSCLGDFHNKVGKYKILNILYYNETNEYVNINTNKDLYFNIKEDILELKRVYGEAHNEKFNILGLIFKNNAYRKYFSQFFLRSVKENKDFNVDFKFVNTYNGGSSDEKIMIDLSKIPLGEYYVNFIYKRHVHINTAVINIEQVENIDISYDDD